MSELHRKKVVSIEKNENKLCASACKFIKFLGKMRNVFLFEMIVKKSIMNEGTIQLPPKIHKAHEDCFPSLGFYRKEVPNELPKLHLQASVAIETYVLVS